jgi:hypothetical protein
MNFPLRKENTGTDRGLLLATSKGDYDHQFSSKYFSDFNLRVGISLTSFAMRFTG